MQSKNSIQMLGLLIILALLSLSLAPAPLHHQSTAVIDSQTNWGKMPLYFIANQGQMDSRVAYYVQGSDKTLYFTPQGVTFASTDLANGRSLARRGKAAKPLSFQERRKGRGRWIIKLDFVGANPVSPVGKEQTDAIISYFKGQPEDWKAGLPTYSKIVYYDLWEGIDLVYNGTVDRLKYEFVVQPGIDPERIQLAYRGASIWVNQAGQLEVRTPRGGFQDDAPVAYQEVDGKRLPVTVAYALGKANQYGFQVGVYDPELPLVIDPAVLVYCGYIGGSGQEGGSGIAADSGGYAYVVGTTSSTGTSFPESVGPDLFYNGGSSDAFVAKVNANGVDLVYAGFIGGDGVDQGQGISIDAAGNAYVVGSTNSDQATFPIKKGPSLTYAGGDYDAFVAKVKADGTELLYCGYIGGDEYDKGAGIAVLMDYAYVTGSTRSTATTFPKTVGPDLSFNGVTDAFVAKVKTDGAGLVYAGYIGGDISDVGRAIAVDLSGNAYITGDTASTQATFPEKVGPDLSYNEGFDAFVAKVKSDGSGFVYAGYIGGNKADVGNGIAVDAAGCAYLTGSTSSSETTFPKKIGPDLTYNDGSNDAFVAMVKADGTELLYAGYIGGSDSDSGSGITVDSLGNAYITGSTESTNVASPSISRRSPSYSGGIDGFIAIVMAEGIELMDFVYIGGEDDDWGSGIALNPANSIFITGVAESTEETFPVDVGPDLTYNGDAYDAFVAKFSSTLGTFLYLPIIKQ